jgi:tetratricopeptide (TPR) repeat protein
MTLATRALKALQRDHPEFAANVLTDANLPNDQAFSTLMACSDTLAHHPTRAAELKVRAAQYLNGLAKANVMLDALDGLIHSEPKQALSLAQNLLEIPDLPDETRARAVYHATFAIATNTRNLAATLESLSRLPESQQHDLPYLGALVGYMMMCGQPARALEIWDTHPELAESGEAAILIHVLSGLMQTAQFARAEELSRQILLRPTLSERETMNVLNIRAITLAQLGQLEVSEEVGLQAIALAKRLELHNALGVMLFNRSVTLERSGQREQMREQAIQALISLGKAGNSGLATQAQLILANDDLESGRYDRCEEHLNDAYSNLKQSTISPFLVHVQMALVRFHVQRHSTYAQTLALKYARDAVQAARVLGQEKLLATAQTHLGVALIAELQLEEAESLLDLAMPVLQDLPDTNSFYLIYAQAKLLEAEGLPAVETWHRAVSRASDLGFLFDARCFQLEIARIERDLQQATVIKNWFEDNALWHGTNLAKNYFADFQDSLPAMANTDFRLEVLGSMQISQNGIRSAVKGQKRKELLARLLKARVSGRSEVKTLEFLDGLYPNSLEDEGISALKQIVFKTRTTYGANIISTTTDGYALGSVSSDAEAFLELGDTTLWRGAFLEGLSASDEVREILIQACQKQVQKMLETNPKEAARVMRLLLESEPYNLEILKLTCQALRLDHNHRSLQRIYHESRAKWLEVGEWLPETWQAFLD